MSYNGSGTFVINSAGMPLVPFQRDLSATFNALTADLATGLSTAITKDGQTTTTALITFAAGISATLVTDATSISTGSLLTSGGLGVTKAAWIGGLMNVAGAATLQSTLAVTGTSTMAAINASGAFTGTTGTFTKAAAGDVLVLTNGGATPKPLYFYSDASTSSIGTSASQGGSLLAFVSTTSAQLNISGGAVQTWTTAATSLTVPLSITAANPGGWATGFRTVVDNNGGEARIYSYGADATTRGSFNFYSLEADGGNNGSVLSIAIGGAVTIPGTLGVTGATTLSAQTTFGERAYLNSTGRISVAGATTIYSIANGGASVGSSATLVLVNGYLVVTPTNSFIDLVLFMPSGTPSVISAINRGSPAARTYTSSGANLQLAMASGTYNVANSNTEQAC